MDPWTTLIYGVCVDTTVEVCNREFLNISCGGAGRVILINAALYGRMRVGRCVQRSLGYVDCQADVLDHIAAIDPELLDPVVPGADWPCVRAVRRRVTSADRVPIG